jgi:ABC-type transporter Mla MlaB component
MANGPADKSQSARKGPVWERNARTLRLSLSERGTLVMSGSLSELNPGAVLMPHLKELHELLVRDGLQVVKVDVRDLSFVNSTGIRVFIDWLGLIQRSGSAYVLHFILDPAVTWQRLTFKALKTLAQGAVVLEEKPGQV